MQGQRQRGGFMSIGAQSRDDLATKRSLFSQYLEPDVPVWSGGAWGSANSPRNGGSRSAVGDLSRMDSIKSTSSPQFRRPPQPGPSAALCLGLLGKGEGGSNAPWPADMGRRPRPAHVVQSPPHAAPTLRQQVQALRRLLAGMTGNDTHVAEAAQQVNAIVGARPRHGGAPIREEVEHLARRCFFCHVAQLIQVPELAPAACELLAEAGQAHPRVLDPCISRLVCVLPQALGYPCEGPPPGLHTRTATRPCSAQFPSGLRHGAVGTRSPAPTSPISTARIGHPHRSPSYAARPCSGPEDSKPDSRLLLAYVHDRTRSEGRLPALRVLRVMARTSAGRAAIMDTPKLRYLMGAHLDVVGSQEELSLVASTILELSRDTRSGVQLGSDGQFLRQLCVATTHALHATAAAACVDNAPPDHVLGLKLAHVLSEALCTLIKRQQSVGQLLLRWEQDCKSSSNSHHRQASPHQAHQLHALRDTRVMQAAVTLLVPARPSTRAAGCAVELLCALGCHSNSDVTSHVRAVLTDEGDAAAPGLLALVHMLQDTRAPVAVRAAAMSLVWLCISGEVRAPNLVLGSNPPPPTSTERFVGELLKPPTSLLQLCLTQFESLQAQPPASPVAMPTTPNASGHDRSGALASGKGGEGLGLAEDSDDSQLDLVGLDDTGPRSDTPGSLQETMGPGENQGTTGSQGLDGDMEEGARTPARVTLHGGVHSDEVLAAPFHPGAQPLEATGGMVNTDQAGVASGAVSSPPAFTFSRHGSLQHGPAQPQHGGAEPVGLEPQRAGLTQVRRDRVTHERLRRKADQVSQLVSSTLSVLSTCACIKAASDVLSKPPTGSPLLPLLLPHVLPLLDSQPPTDGIELGRSPTNLHLQHQALVLCSNVCLYPEAATMVAEAGATAKAEHFVQKLVIDGRQLSCSAAGRHGKPGQQLLESAHDQVLEQLAAPAALLLANYWRHQPHHQPQLADVAAAVEGAARVRDALASAVLRLLPQPPALPLEGLVPSRPRAAVLPSHLSLPRLQAVQHLCTALTQVTRVAASATTTAITTAVESGASNGTHRSLSPHQGHAATAGVATVVAQMIVDVTPVAVEYLLLGLDDRTVMNSMLGALHAALTCTWTLMACGTAPPAPVIKALLPVLPLLLVGPRPARAGTVTAKQDGDGANGALGGGGAGPQLPQALRSGALGLVMLACRASGAVAVVVSHTACMEALLELYRLAQRLGTEQASSQGLDLQQLQELLVMLRPADKKRFNVLRSVRLPTPQPAPANPSSEAPPVAATLVEPAAEFEQAGLGEDLMVSDQGLEAGGQGQDILTDVLGSEMEDTEA